MKKHTQQLLFVAALFFGGETFAQPYQSAVRQGNKAFNTKTFDEAELNYRKATEAKPDGFEGWYNLGSALYKQERFNEALDAYNRSLLSAPSTETEAKAHHNIGNTFMAQQQYEKAIEAYKKSLRLNPKDDETRYNLARALEQLKKEQSESKSDQKEKNNKQEKNDQKNENQDKEDPEKSPNKDNKEGDDRDGVDKDEKNEKQDKPGEKEGDAEPKQENLTKDGREVKMTQQEAKALLDAAENAERKTRERIEKEKKKKQKAKTAPGVKDW